MKAPWAHFVSVCCRGESCHICREEGRKVPASHKVGEEIPHDEPAPSAGGIKMSRHNLTAYC